MEANNGDWEDHVPFHTGDFLVSFRGVRLYILIVAAPHLFQRFIAVSRKFLGILAARFFNRILNRLIVLELVGWTFRVQIVSRYTPVTSIHAMLVYWSVVTCGVISFKIGGKL